MWNGLTDEVIWAEEVVVPDLECEAWGQVVLRLGQAVEVLLHEKIHDTSTLLQVEQ